MNLLNFVIKGGTEKKFVAEQTETCETLQLANCEPTKAPPFIYVGGAQSFTLSPGEQKVVRQYLLEKHGMILGDNLGGSGFHNHFIATMNAVTGVEPVVVPRDDIIHRIEFNLPELPFVVAHGGKVPLGWKVDGRWVAYYHPGALSDAWRDDHAGIKRDVWEACYQLGVNLMRYACEEHYKWRESQKP